MHSKMRALLIYSAFTRFKKLVAHLQAWRGVLDWTNRQAGSRVRGNAGRFDAASQAPARGMNRFKFLRALAPLAGLASAWWPAGAATLNIGDPAPPLQFSQWVQGDPVRTFDRQHVYLVEFWATWCVPCRSSIPRLNDFWRKFKDHDLVVIGADISEPDDHAVPAFLAKMGDQLTYPVALDDKSQDKNGAMAAHWMQAAGLNGIPTAFVVDRQGRIAWIGHPLALQESAIAQILAGQFDVTAYAREYARQQEALERRQELSQRLHQALAGKDWAAADDALTGLEKLLPADAGYQLARVQIQLGRKDYAGACKHAAEASDAHPDNVNLQNGLAWMLAVTKGVDPAGLALAEKIALRANTAAQGKNSQVLDTLARAQFLNGHTSEAAASERKAVALAPEQEKTFLKRVLTDYQVGLLPEVNE